ncbi:TetR/AcrR family transcriptional regulator [Streptomyces varsoviensis]|nr:TetR/AcrR family transcriptional regulator [Streptomyces varsoviensis]
MGRSRMTPERESELYHAVLDLLGEVGYDALTMDAVAARTRSSKATLYRQWKGKPELVVRALRHVKPHAATWVDTGSLRGDLHAIAASTDDCEKEKSADLIGGLIHAVRDDPDLYEALRELMIEPGIEELNAVLRRAVERGEVAADSPALEFLPHMLVGGYVTRPLVEAECVTTAYLRRYLDAVVLPALGV